MSPLWHLTTSAIYLFFFFFFNDTATTEIYTLSLHDALPICDAIDSQLGILGVLRHGARGGRAIERQRSEEHTSELQSLRHLVCRLLLEKKKTHRSESYASNHNRTYCTVFLRRKRTIKNFSLL